MSTKTADAVKSTGAAIVLVPFYALLGIGALTMAGAGLAALGWMLYTLFSVVFLGAGEPPR